MNYYKSKNHPFNKNIHFVYLTANGDFFYYGTEELTDDIPITEEEYYLEVAKEEHVEYTPLKDKAPQDSSIANEDFDLSEVLATIYEAIIEKE